VASQWRALSQEERTLWCLAAAYVLIVNSAGVSCVQQYRYAGLLPPPENGLSDITDLVVARFGVLTPGKVLFIRTRQQIDGVIDVPRVVSAVIPFP
jgi:hypothetical protein